MSQLVMSAAEEKSIDSRVEQMMEWARTRRAEAEQLALDSARLMACATDRLDRLSRQGFFKRCWNRFTGKTSEMERANINDVIQMQKMAFRYVNMLQEQQLLMAHSLLALKNNLASLSIKEEETRELVGLLAQKTLARFVELEGRVDQLEISTNLQGWLLGLEERDYDEKYPTEYMRLFRVINDFYSIKNDNWNYNDLMFMRKAIRTVGINPKRKLSLNAFIDSLTEEIQNDGVGFDAYGNAISMFKPERIMDYSKYVLENISSPVFVAMHGLKSQYMDRLDMVEELQEEMNISAGEALKRLLRRSIKNLNVDLDYEFTLAETAIEILACLRLSERLTTATDDALDCVGTESIGSIVDNDENPAEEKAINPCGIIPIDLDNCRFGPWEEARQFDGHTLDASCMVAKGDNIYTYCTEGYADDSRIYLYSSNDMMNWTRVSKIQNVPKTLSTSLMFNHPEFKNIGGKIFYIYDEKHVAMLNDKGELQQLNLPQSANGDEIKHIDILYNGTTWLFCGKYWHHYVENNMESYLISATDDFENFQHYNFINEYSTFRVIQ